MRSFRLGTLILAVGIVTTTWGGFLALGECLDHSSHDNGIRITMLILGSAAAWPLVQIVLTRDSYRTRAEHHADAEQYWYERWQACREDLNVPTDPPQVYPADECRSRSEWHGMLKRKYRFAVSYPWVRVPPDPIHPDQRTGASR